MRALDGDIRIAELPEQTFDAIVSVDAFEYFGTDMRFLPRVLASLKPSGLIAMSTPALRNDPYQVGIPPHVEEVVGWEAAGWHSPDWWQRHWELTGMVTAISSRWQTDGRGDWLTWEIARREYVGDTEPSCVIDMLEADTDEQIGFALVSARKRHDQ